MGADFPFRWIIALAVGVALGAAIGALQGFIIAYIGVPSFIVTLGGLLAIRGVVWYLSAAPPCRACDPTFQLSAAAPQGSIGGTLTLGPRRSSAASPSSGSSSTTARQRRRFGFPVRPMWAEVLLGIGRLRWRCSGSAAFANANYWPKGLADRSTPSEHGIAEPPGGLHDLDGHPVARSSSSSASPS